MESNHLPVGYQPTARLESLTGVGPERGLEPRYLRYQRSTSPSMLSRQNWGLAADLNRALNVTSVVRRHLRLQGMGPKEMLEIPPAGYRPAALPLKLLRQICAGVLPLDDTGPKPSAWIRTTISGSLERIIGLEPMYADWQSAVLATGRNPRTWSERRESNSRLWFGRPGHKPLYHARLLTLRLSKNYGRGGRIRTCVALIPNQVREPLRYAPKIKKARSLSTRASSYSAPMMRP